MRDKFYSMYITMKYDDNALLCDKIEYEMTNCKILFEYLRLRGCNGVYTRILNPTEGLVKIVFRKGHANPSDIIRELNQLSKDYGWTVREVSNQNGNTESESISK